MQPAGTKEYRDIIERLDTLVKAGSLSDFDRTTLLETANDVIREIAKKYEKVVEGMGEVMGGALLETNARKIKNEGKAAGQKMVVKRSKRQKVLAIFGGGRIIRLSE